MKLGACYNLFDCEELLETSILSIRPSVDYIVVVYQLISNFGNPCNPHLEEFLLDLVQKGLVEELVLYTPKIFEPEEKMAFTSKEVRPEELGGPVETIGNQFLNEISKREIGRLKCAERGCTHFMTIDADEYYLTNELNYAKEKILKFDYDATACRMRIFFKEPIYEYFPYDNVNSVPLIYKISSDMDFKLAHPYPAVLDPTRRIQNFKRFYHFERSEIEMYHMTFVRKDITQKLKNVSNRVNYGDITEALLKWNSWTPEKGVLHPHPYIGKLFTEIRTVSNLFGIDLAKQCAVCCKTGNLSRCARCKNIRYCSKNCQIEDWNRHREACFVVGNSEN
eukprot:TRINITY_DN12891_c0_g1_i1.p1 TRINITY_DN12891_c0_g1~~TRINITY_DN12891_c0_g1_i1.p1  ORF type:complete len:337 (-),score=56.28 TRINITY_DN12891_c0_g1_i1:4-1014(-)